jgi:hypothetical protein
MSPVTYPYPQPPKKGMSKWLVALIVAGVLVLGCCGLGVVGLAIGAGEDANDPAETSEAASTEAGETSPADEPETSSAPVEPEPTTEAKPDQLAEMQDAVENDADVDGAKVKQLGRGRWEVTFDVSDNLSMDFIRGGMASDVFDFSKQIEQEIGDDTAVVRLVRFVGMFPLTDKFGNEEKGRVFAAELTGETINAINYDNIIGDWESLEPLLERGYFLHPDLQ